jgi:hypothetical protein
MKNYKLFKPRFNQREGTPDDALTPIPVQRYAACDCYTPRGESLKRQEIQLHSEVQDTTSEEWNLLEAYIDDIRVNQSDEFNPLNGIGAGKWQRIVTLPRSIGTLQSVKFVSLYGSGLVRIPPEIGEMSSLEEFDPYTSYRLHWFPYEITRCKKLKSSRVSTRALYGNFKYRSPFPRLPSLSANVLPASCSVCRGQFTNDGPLQLWISLRVADDVLPLLVHACSRECVRSLPPPPDGYVSKPHLGGLDLQQPRPYHG